MAIWIDDQFEDITKGQCGFLVYHSPQDREAYYTLTDTPGRTNLSHEPSLRGWLGNTQNVYAEAKGVYRVARVTRNGRALVAPLDAEEERAWLVEAGWEVLLG